MNKLEVALKLLQLLNERKAVDSKTVAHELNVSLRTAQRYLIELSMLPCVRNNLNSRTYCLDSEYQLNQAIKGRSGSDSLKKINLVQRLEIDKHICFKCGKSGDVYGLVDFSLFPPLKNMSNIAKIDRLTAIISKRLMSRRRSFP